ncbi:MAG: glycosyltransferase family 2 protein [Deltaproteobacteria bacterium]|nr:glycosyltransferase family 2 protein [Deltaproteobacteria bacterium]
MNKDDICVLIPAYNAEGTIGEVIERTKKFIPRVIVVDDGSTDATGEVARRRDCELITLPSNLGKGYALRRGFAQAFGNGCRAIVTLDADGQHDPADIPRFLEAHGQDSAAILIGSRMAEAEKFPRERYYSNQVGVFFISKALGQHLEDTQCGFRLYPAQALKPMELKTAHFQTETEILIRASRRGVRLRSIPIKNIYWNGNHLNGHAPKSHFRPVVDTFYICLVVLQGYLRLL